MNKNGFSLIEVLLYVAILAIVSGLFVGILSVSTKVQLRESANNEVGTQLNFVLQTIQRLVRESSNIEFAKNDDPVTPVINEGDNPDTTSTEAAYIKLRMPKSTDDPTCIAWVPDDKSIMLTQGPQPGPGNEYKCKNLTPGDALTTAKVIVPVSPPGFVAIKFSNYPGHDSVQIDLTLNFNTDNPQSAFQKKLTTGIGRVSAATFDSSLLPATPVPPNPQPEIGSLGLPWDKAYIKDLILSGTISQPENYGPNTVAGTTRGYKTVFTVSAIGVGFFPGEIAATCANICPAHGLACLEAFDWPDLVPRTCTATGQAGYFCICK